MSMIIQIVGSLGVLAGFALAQWGVLNQKSISYLIINAVGSGLLAADAVVEQQWGFLLLEGSWSVISVIGLVRAKLKTHTLQLQSNDSPYGSNDSKKIVEP
ncbi:MAG: hypothetical protein LBH39_04775 [Clostridiales Family XIII bacterium]|nr:hypothetical protein [Clostridiales Family XIII bacterium]